MIKPNNCELCGKEEDDGCWIKKNHNENTNPEKDILSKKNNFHYICHKCINDFFNIIETEIKK